MSNNTMPLHKAAWIEKLAIKIFTEIEALTKDKVGVSRESYGKGETIGINYLIDLAKKIGLCIETDDAANVYLSIEKSTKSNHILIGSHMDSVPQGGNFDGLAGGIAGFLILVNLKEKKIKTSLPVKLLVLRGEESAWYGKNCIGSKALFGLISSEDLKSTHRSNGKKLSKAMAETGARLDLIRK